MNKNIKTNKTPMTFWMKVTEGFKRFINYFNPKFIDVNNQKVTKKFPWLLILSWILGSVSFIWIMVYLNPNFDFWNIFWDSLKNFFEPNVSYKAGASSIAPMQTFVITLELLWKTIAYSVLGTLLGIIISIPLAMLSSKNIIKKAYIYMPMRVFMSILRAIPPLVYAFFFYNLLSPGLTATLSIGIFVSTLMTKWLYEDLDTYDVSAYEGMQAIGNNKQISFNKAIFPYLSKRIMSYGLYSFEMVIRFAAILSLVGIESIGSWLGEMSQAVERFSHLSIVIWVLVATIILIETMNFLIKKFILEYKPKHVVIDKTKTHNEQVEQLVKQKPKIWILKLAIAIIVLALIVASLIQIDYYVVNSIKLRYFATGVKKIFNPDWSYITEFNTGVNVIQTGFTGLFVAIGATIFGFFLSLILGILSSKNITKYFSYPFKFCIIVIRSIPVFTYAALFIFLIKENNEFMGALALGIHSIGMLGKLVFESIEKIDKKVFESLDSVGANWYQKIWYGVIKSIMPQALSNGLYRIEINFKSLVVLGAVGANVFGSQMSMFASDVNNFDKLSVYIIFTIIIMLIFEQISNILRNKLINGYFFSEKSWIARFLKNKKRIKALAITRVLKEKFVYSKYSMDYELAKNINRQLWFEEHDEKYAELYNQYCILKFNAKMKEQTLELRSLHNRLVLIKRNFFRNIKNEEIKIKNDIKNIKKDAVLIVIENKKANIIPQAQNTKKIAKNIAKSNISKYFQTA